MDDLDDIFSNLKIDSNDPSDCEDAGKYFEELDIALQKNETTSKWMKEVGEENGPVSFDEICKLRKNAERENDEEGDANALIYSVVEIIAKRCLQVEIKIQQSDFQAASKDIEDILNFVNKHKAYYANKEYVIGFRYVAKCLAIKGRLKEIKEKGEPKQINVSRLKELLESLNEYQDFGIQHQVAVLAIKQYFVGNLRKGKAHEYQLGILRDLVKMEPENLEWRFCLYSVLRFKRAASRDFSTPSQEEIDVINEADSMRYAMFDARICLGYAFCLAELVKSSEKHFSPIKYGRKVFYSAVEALECIRSKVDDLLAIDPTSVRSNIDVAKIYSSILPYAHRDTTFAMVCIKRALLFHPNSSKANHRMAVLLMSNNSPSAAVEYLEKAVENDERNHFATLDLLKVYMANIPSYKIKMEQIFSDPSHKAGKEYAEYLILQAIFEHLNGKNQKSVDLLIEAVTNNAKCIDSLKKIQSNFKRCNWGDYNSFANGIKGILQIRMNSCRTAAEKDIINKICESLRNNEYKNNRGNFQSGRGRYEQFFRGSHGSYRTGGDSSYGGSRSGSGYDYKSGRSGYSGSQSDRDSGHSGYDYKSGRSGYGGSQSDRDSGHGNKSGGSQTKSFKFDSDDYVILGLSKPTTQLDIKKQFRKLALENHPDKNMHLSADERLEKQELMKRINSAYFNLKL